MIWMHELGRVAVKATIVFQIGREQMIKATIQFFENPSQRLLTDISDTPIASKIERLLKFLKFSLAHPSSPSKAQSSFKEQKININSSSSERSFVGGRGRGGYVMRDGRSWRGRGGGRFGLRNPSITSTG